MRRSQIAGAVQDLRGMAAAAAAADELAAHRARLACALQDKVRRMLDPLRLNPYFLCMPQMRTLMLFVLYMLYMLVRVLFIERSEQMLHRCTWWSGRSAACSASQQRCAVPPFQNFA